MTLTRVREVLAKPEAVGALVSFAALVVAVVAHGVFKASDVALSVLMLSTTWSWTRDYYRNQVKALEGQLHWAEAQAENWQKTAQNYQKAYRK